jgi:hypothetical protein
VRKINLRFGQNVYPLDSFGKTIFIQARLWNKFLQLILFSFESASWNQPVLVSYEETSSWPDQGSNPWSLGWEADTLTTRLAIERITDNRKQRRKLQNKGTDSHDLSRPSSSTNLLEIDVPHLVKFDCWNKDT